MIILGVDPGTRFCGYALVRKEGSKAFLLAHGCLTLNGQKLLPERLAKIYDFFGELIREWRVTDLALETPFLGKNAQNFLKLGYVRGVLYVLAVQNNVHVSEFSPRQVKMGVTGFGGASKEQVARMIMTLFPRLGTQKLREDETDALAVTVCGLWQNRFLSARQEGRI